MGGGCGYTIRCELQLLEISLQTMVDSTVCLSVVVKLILWFLSSCVPLREKQTWRR